MFSCSPGMIGYARAKLNFYSVVLLLKNYAKVYSPMTFRLATDARLHQKAKNQGGEPILSESSKN